MTNNITMSSSPSPSQQSTCVYNTFTRALAIQLLNDVNINDVHERHMLLTSLLALKGPLPLDHPVRDSQYFVSYQDRIDEAFERFRRNVASIQGTIQDIRQDALHHGIAYTTEMEHADKQLFQQQYTRFLRRDLAVAESYRNELYNYAEAALMEWIKYGVEFDII